MVTVGPKRMELLMIGAALDIQLGTALIVGVLHVALLLTHQVSRKMQLMEFICLLVTLSTADICLLNKIKFTVYGLMVNMVTRQIGS